MLRVNVAHAVYSWLPVTQNWVYSQLRWNTSCDHSVISVTEEQGNDFPVAQRYTAFPKTLPGRFGVLLARYWFRQPSAFFRRTIASIAPDIIHGHFSHESWRLLPFAREAGLPLVTTFYGLDVDKLPRRRAWQRRYRELFAYGARFLVEGPFMGKRLEAIGCPSDTIRVIALGVDRSLYHSNDRPPDDGKRPVKILFTGLGREKKGAPDAAASFIAAATQDERLELHIIGDGSYRKNVEQILRGSGMLHRAVFHGYVTFDRYRELLAGSDMVLVPSRYAADGDCEGGAPVVCIEAQAAGIPVVGTRHCDIPFVVTHGSTGLLSAEGDRASLARDLLRLAQDATLRKQLGEQGREQVARQHAVTLQAEKIAEVYREVVSRRERTVS